ncbi:MAG: metallophosphoesterase [Spirochaetia bacterium]|nr:metallophosphoesterase [Spirochaetia bacterium]
MEFLNSQEKILGGFRQTYNSVPEIVVAPDEQRFVVFSDHHRGDRGYSDYFQRCEKTYNAALGYYLERGFHLILLGDVEEFWENHPRTVMKSYPLTYELEREFYLANRLTRVRGNHDSLWKNPALVEEYLGPLFPGIVMQEGLRIRVMGPEPVTVFFAHGHQGTFLSDTLDWFSMFWFRTLGSRIIHPFKRKYQTPARNYALREEHETMMFDCAAALNQEVGEKTLLVCGHTHHPIFMSQNRIRRMQNDAHILRTKNTKKSLKRLARLRAQFEYVKADFGLDEELMSKRSFYFNTGCCSFDDGSITGIELAKGKIKLIKWTDESTHADRIILGSERLSAI